MKTNGLLMLFNLMIVLCMGSHVYASSSHTIYLIINQPGVFFDRLAGANENIGSMVDYHYIPPQPQGAFGQECINNASITNGGHGSRYVEIKFDDSNEEPFCTNSGKWLGIKLMRSKPSTSIMDDTSVKNTQLASTSNPHTSTTGNDPGYYEVKSLNNDYIVWAHALSPHNWKSTVMAGKNISGMLACCDGMDYTTYCTYPYDISGNSSKIFIELD